MPSRRAVRMTRQAISPRLAIRIFEKRPRRAIAQSGMLSCFFHGFSSSLSRSMASERATRRRVRCGMITSSMKPRWPATKGLANFSRYSWVRASIFGGIADIAAEDDLDRALRAHHRDLGRRPGVVDVAAQVLGAHDVVGAAIGLAGDHGDLRHGRLGEGVEQLRAVLDDAAIFLRGARAGSRARRRRSRSGC